MQLVLPVVGNFKVGAREILTTKLKVHRAKVGDGVICAGGSDHRLYQGLFPVEQSESNDDEPVPSQAQANKQQNNKLTLEIFLKLCLSFTLDETSPAKRVRPPPRVLHPAGAGLNLGVG